VTVGPSDGQAPVSWDGRSYQDRFDRLEASGLDVHGEAGFAMRWAPTSVLDAGCGTGRVARELARRGVDTVGVDLDRSMIDTARQLDPDLTWVLGDLCLLDLGRSFDMVVMAGNVPLFAPAETRGPLVAGCSRHLGPDARLVSGFQLGRGYLLTEYDEHCRQVGLACTGRWSTWSGEPYTDDSGYAVSVHQPNG
jgi:SAM-dependent methyltransferase